MFSTITFGYQGQIQLLQIPFEKGSKPFLVEKGSKSFLVEKGVVFFLVSENFERPLVSYLVKIRFSNVIELTAFTYIDVLCKKSVSIGI